MYESGVGLGSSMGQHKLAATAVALQHLAHPDAESAKGSQPECKVATAGGNVLAIISRRRRAFDRL